MCFGGKHSNCSVVDPVRERERGQGSEMMGLNQTLKLPHSLLVLARAVLLSTALGAQAVLKYTCKKY